MSTSWLPPPLANLLLNLSLHHLADDGQTQLGGEDFYVFTHTGYELFHRQLAFQGQPDTIVCFSFGLLLHSAVLSHRWFSWFCCFFLRQPILFDGRRENHLQFQLPPGHPRRSEEHTS